MSHIHYSTDEGVLETNDATATSIVCFQTMPDCRGQFFARINAMTNTGLVKVWQYSVRFRRIGSGTPVLATPVSMVEDGDPETAAWSITFSANADGIICMMCAGSDMHTTWIGKFNAVETCSE